MNKREIRYGIYYGTHQFHAEISVGSHHALRVFRSIGEISSEVEH